MPVERHPISVSQLCELLGVDPKRFIAVECERRDSTTVTIVLEPDETRTNHRHMSAAER